MNILRVMRKVPSWCPRVAFCFHYRVSTRLVCTSRAAQAGFPAKNKNQFSSVAPACQKRPPPPKGLSVRSIFLFARRRTIYLSVRKPSSHQPPFKPGCVVPNVRNCLDAASKLCREMQTQNRKLHLLARRYANCVRALIERESSILTVPSLYLLWSRP